jgi:hypothetical protein
MRSYFHGGDDLNLFPAISALTLLALFIGVAGQNIVLGVIFVLFYFSGSGSIKHRIGSLTAALNQTEMRHYLVCFALITVPIVSSTIAHGNFKDAYHYFFGYLELGVLPIFFYLFKNRICGLPRLLDGIVGFMAVIALSQLIWPWKFENGQIVESIARAQGFFSHPLTFAYAALVGMPFLVLTKIDGLKKNILGGLQLLPILLIVAASQSVTVVVLTVMVLAFGVLVILPRSWRIKSLVACVLLCVGVLTTKNPLSNKVHNVLTGQRGDHETPYPDDRMAFWNAHWLMFLDEPIAGHGTGLEAKDRAPYYENLGLGYLKRKYEAHQMFLQAMVEGGFIAGLGLVVFLVWIAKLGWERSEGAILYRSIAVLTPLSFALGGLTQNAFQDSEVRYALFVYLSFLMAFDLSRMEQVRVLKK